MIFLALIVVAAFGLVIAKEVRFLLRARGCTEPSRAVVKSLREKVFLNGSSHRSTFIPTVELTVDGNTYNAEAEHSYNYDTHPVGSEVWVYYDPQNPWHMILAAERKSAVSGIVTAVILLAVCIGYFVFLMEKYGI